MDNAQCTMHNAQCIIWLVLFYSFDRRTVERGGVGETDDV